MKPPVFNKRVFRIGQLLLAGCVFAATDSFASSPNTVFTDHARVVDVEPLVRMVRVSTPRRECWDEVVTIRRAPGNSYTPEIVGSIVGAAVGNRFGRGSGRDIATIAGAVLGGTLGHDYKSRRGRPGEVEQVVEERCEIHHDVQTEERVEGYRVTYRYHGRDYTTRMDQDPGDRIPVSVSVRPLY